MTSSRKATKVHQLRPAAVQRQHVDAEGCLKRRETEQLRQNDLGLRVALDFDHHAHAVAVGFVAQVGNALDLFVADGLGHDLDHAGLVDLIGNLVNDDREAVLADFLDRGFAADDDGPAARVIGR